MKVRNSKDKVLKENGTVDTYYYDNGNIRSEYYYLNSERHNENGPAYISYYENGNIKYEQHCINNKYHNENGPAVISYYENGNIKYEYYWINGTDVTEILKEWHKQNNIPTNNLTKEQKILRKIQIGL